MPPRSPGPRGTHWVTATSLFEAAQLKQVGPITYGAKPVEHAYPTRRTSFSWSQHSCLLFSKHVAVAASRPAVNTYLGSGFLCLQSEGFQGFHHQGKQPNHLNGGWGKEPEYGNKEPACYNHTRTPRPKFVTPYKVPGVSELTGCSPGERMTALWM